MGMLTLTGGAAAIVGIGAYYLRRRMARTWIDVQSDPTDLTNKVVIITGGNVGVGYEAALDLTRRNAHVIIGCRDLTKGQEAVRSIQDAVKKNQTSGSVECLQVDLASLTSVRSFAETIKEKFKGRKNIHALVLNAGVWMPMEQHAKTSDGLEIHFGVNHLAHFELANLLKDHLVSVYTSDDNKSRIIFVSSSLAKQGKLDWESQDFVTKGRELAVNEKKAFAPTGYCDSKLMNMLCAKHLSSLLPENVAACSLSPGFCRSQLGRNTSVAFYKQILLAPVLRLVQRTTVQGAQNIIYTVICEFSDLEKGAVYRDGQVCTELMEHMKSLGSDAPQKLWNLSEKLVKEMK